MMTQLVSDDAVREYLLLNPTPSNSRYDAASIGSNVRAAQSFLERATHRFIVPRTFADTPWTLTTMLRAEVALPGFRSFTRITWGGSELTVNLPGETGGACWAIPDSAQSGVYVALQFRAWRADMPGWWLADRNWFDKALDSPFYPGNVGGGYAWTSLPNDLCIWGEAGWSADTVPDDALLAIKALAAFWTLRPASLLADVALSPQGAVINYAQLPAEARQFISNWALGEQAVSVG